MDFKETEKINVTKHIEKKGRFSYLSWPFAVSEFRKACSQGTWVVRNFGNNAQPYCDSKSGCFVIVDVWPDAHVPNVFFTQVHPILDNKNKTVTDPDAFQINTSIQRCLVKAIALATGIGLHIYAGEDLPPSEDPAQKKKLTDAEERTRQGNIKSWKGIWSGEKEKGAEGKAWWTEVSKSVVKDCGTTGAEEVLAEVKK